MVKNNFKMPVAYASPAVKMTRLHSRRVLCQSIPLQYGDDPGAPGKMGDDNSYDDVF